MTRKNITLKDHIESEANSGNNTKGEMIGLKVEDFLEELENREAFLAEKVKLYSADSDDKRYLEDILQKFSEISLKLKADLSGNENSLTLDYIEDEYGEYYKKQLNNTIIDAKIRKGVPLNSNDNISLGNSSKSLNEVLTSSESKYSKSTKYQDLVEDLRDRRDHNIESIRLD